MTQSPTRHKIFAAEHPFLVKTESEDGYRTFSNARCAVDFVRTYARNLTNGFEGPKRAWSIKNTATGEVITSACRADQLREFQAIAVAPKGN